MGRKKPIARDDEIATVAQGGGSGKSKNKNNLVIDDDEYSIGTELSEESNVQEEKTAPVGGGKKKGKKGNAKKGGLKDDDDDDDEQLEDQNVEGEDDEAPAIQFAGKKKGKGKKGANIKSNSAFSSSNFGLLGDEGSETEVSELTQSRDGESGDSEGEADIVVSFTGKKKPTKSKQGGGKNVFTASAFDIIGDEDEEADGDSVSGKLSDNDDEPVIAFTGKKKPSKSSKKGGGSTSTTSAFGAIGDEDDGDVDDLVSGKQYDNEEPLIEFSGKKKPSKSGKKGGGSSLLASSFDGLGDGENKEESKEEDEDIASITFTGKKKKSSRSSKKSSANSFDAAFLDEETNEDVSVSKPGDEAARDDISTLDDLDTSAATFSGKKKSSKKKGNGAFTALDTGLGDESSVVVEATQPGVSAGTKQIAEDVAETSKNKKKKKKSGRTAQEEEDLDKILAELGEAPPASKPSPTPTPGLLEPTTVEKVQSEPEPEDGAGQLSYCSISKYCNLCSF